MTFPYSGGWRVESWPEFVVVPARRSPDGPELETRHRAAGEDLVLPAFSSVASVMRLLGHGQPWVCVRLRDASAAAAGLAGVVIDPEEIA
jgi:SseB protein N-terminal domain